MRMINFGIALYNPSFFDIQQEKLILIFDSTLNSSRH